MQQKSSALPKRIENEEQYNEVLARLVKGAKMLDNPLLDKEIREKCMNAYDLMCWLIDDYKKRENDAFEQKLKVLRGVLK